MGAMVRCGQVVDITRKAMGSRKCIGNAEKLSVCFPTLKFKSVAPEPGCIAFWSKKAVEEGDRLVEEGGRRRRSKKAVAWSKKAVEEGDRLVEEGDRLVEEGDAIT